MASIIKAFIYKHKVQWPGDWPLIQLTFISSLTSAWTSVSMWYPLKISHELHVVETLYPHSFTYLWLHFLNDSEGFRHRGWGWGMGVIEPICSHIDRIWINKTYNDKCKNLQRTEYKDKEPMQNGTRRSVFKHMCMKYKNQRVIRCDYFIK